MNLSMRLISLCFLCSFLSPVSLLADHLLRGNVVSEKDGTALERAVIFIPDLKIGTITNASGNYYLNDIPKGIYLVSVRMVGYRPVVQELVIDGETTFNFSLSDELIELPEIVVTGVTSAVNNRNNPLSINTIDPVTLERQSSTIVESISRVPGVSAITTGPIIEKPVVRGLGGSRLAIIHDGVRQEGQQWNEEFGLEVDEYTVDKVEILKGPGSLAYGSDAMAGVVNLLDREEIMPDSLHKISGNITSNYQSNNGLIAFSSYVIGMTKKLMWNVRYTHKSARAYVNRYDGPVWNSGFGMSNLKLTTGGIGRWGYSFLHASQYNLSMGEIEGTRDSLTGQFTKHFLSSTGKDSLGIAPRHEYFKYYFYPIFHQSVRHTKVVSRTFLSLPRGQLNVTLGYQWNDRREANDITLGDVYNSKLLLKTLTYTIHYTVQAKDTRFNLGVNGMTQDSRNKGVVFIVPDYHSFDVGAYSIFQRSIKRVTLSGGLRYDFRLLHSSDMFLDNSGKRTGESDGVTQRFKAFDADFRSLTGSFGTAFAIGRNFHVKANVSRGFRAPNISETSSDGIQDDGAVYYKIGDPGLKPEQNLQLDMTLTYNDKQATVQFMPFFNKIENYIFLSKLSSTSGGDSLRTDAEANLTGPAYKFVSGDAFLSGAELTIELHPRVTEGFRWENSLSWVKGIQQHQDDSSRYLPGIPPVKLSSYLYYNAKKPILFFSNAYFFFGWDKFFDQDNVYLKFDTETSTPGYTLLNAGMGINVCSRERTLFSIHLQVRNLLDVAYQYHLSRLKYFGRNPVTERDGIFSMGRNFSVKLSVPF